MGGRHPSTGLGRPQKGRDKPTTDAERSQQAKEIYELRLAGYTPADIAEKMGMTYGTVIRRLRMYIDNRPVPEAEQYRQLSIDRAEKLLTKLESAIEVGDYQAIRTASNLIEKIFKFAGLESLTVKHEGELSISGPIEAEIAQLAEQLGLQPPPVTDVSLGHEPAVIEAELAG